MNDNSILLWLAAKAGWRRRGVRHQNMGYCLNCGSSLTPEDNFCPNCGQKVHESKLSLFSLIAEFFAGIFNLDNSLYRSLRYVLVPGYLTNRFIEGKRKKFLNPIRFFIVILILHVAVLNYIIDIDGLIEQTNKSISEIGRIELYDDYLALKDTIDLSPAEQAHFEEIFDDYIGDTTYRYSDIEGDILGFDLDALKLEKVDLYEMPIPEIIEKYPVDTFRERLFLAQLVRALREPVGAIRHALGALIWSVFLSIFLTGLLLKLIYIRRGRYYVEHLIFLFHVNSTGLLVASAVLGGAYLMREDGLASINGSIWAIAYGISGIFLFLSMKFYYRQGWIKTFFKYCFIGFASFIIIMLSLVFVGMASLLFFK